MSSTLLHNCANCGRQYNPKVLKKCPVCGTPYSYDPNSVVRVDEGFSNITDNGTRSKIEEPGKSKQSSQKLQFARLAGNSAKSVEIYGRVIQYIGYTYAALVFVTVAFYVGPALEKKFLGFLIGAVIGIFIALINHVAGALYRMIANYILFKTAD